METEKVQFISPAEFITLMNMDCDRLHVEPDGMICLQYEFEVQASDFLKFAEADLQLGTTNGLVNALSNAKRAIDCQIDSILGCFGMLSRHSIPQKLKALGDLGMVTPRIVNKVVKARNYLEHEYKKPEQDQVEDAVDIATLFVISLDAALRNFWDHLIIFTIVDGIYDEGEPFHDRWISVDYQESQKLFELSGIVFDEPPTPESRKARHIGPTIIRSHEKGFTELVKLSFLLNKSISEDELKKQAIQFVQLFFPCNP